MINEGGWWNDDEDDEDNENSDENHDEHDDDDDDDDDDDEDNDDEDNGMSVDKLQNQSLSLDGNKKDQKGKEDEWEKIPWRPKHGTIAT